MTFLALTPQCLARMGVVLPLPVPHPFTLKTFCIPGAPVFMLMFVDIDPVLESDPELLLPPVGLPLPLPIVNRLFTLPAESGNGVLGGRGIISTLSPAPLATFKFAWVLL